MNTKQHTIKSVETLLKTNTLNKSEVARRMYPHLKTSSAAAKLKNKLDRKNGFRFTEKEQSKLVIVVSNIIKVVA